MKLAGVDEAGRGPVIGPLVVAGVMIDESQEHELITLGVKDSKLLSDLQRKRFYDAIIAKYEHFIIVVEPDEIDAAVESTTSNLNLLETQKMAMIINKLVPDKVIIDAPSTNIAKFTETLRTYLKKDTTIQAEHKADLIYPVVSAASILAKETREMLVEEIKRKHNVDCGSGYPADPKTKEFLRENYNNPKYIYLFRKSWATYKNMVKEKAIKQRSLGDF